MAKQVFLTPREVADTIQEVADNPRHWIYEGTVDREIRTKIKDAFESLASKFRYMEPEDTDDSSRSRW